MRCVNLFELHQLRLPFHSSHPQFWKVKLLPVHWRMFLTVHLDPGFCVLPIALSCPLGQESAGEIQAVLGNNIFFRQRTTLQKNLFPTVQCAHYGN